MALACRSAQSHGAFAQGIRDGAQKFFRSFGTAMGIIMTPQAQAARER